MPTLYVTEPGCRVEKEYHRLLVTDPEDNVILAVPLIHVTEVVVVGSVGFTTQALVQLLEAGIPVSMISRSGHLLGRLQPVTGRNIYLRRKQYACAANADLSLQLSKSIVLGKLRNQHVIALRLSRSHAGIDVFSHSDLKETTRLIEAARDFDTLRGLEGNTARRYFSMIRTVIPVEWDFSTRSRRPPRSPINALLSLGYSLLTQNIATALEIAGLDPYDGFYHADAYGRPALALDLMEEFRSVIVDSVVLLVINKKILKPDDFIEEAGGYVLKPSGLKKFFHQYAVRLRTCYYHPLTDKPISYQKIFEVQARQLRKVIESDHGVYHPFLLR